MKKEKNIELVWKVNKFKSPVILLPVSFIILSSFFFYMNKEVLGKLIWTLFLIISLYILIKMLSHNFSIYNNGIMMDSLKYKRLGEFKIEESRVFIPWSDIKYISLKNYLVGASYVKNPKPFVSIKTKKGRRYECLVYDPLGFLNALNNIGKSNLVKRRFMK